MMPRGHELLLPVNPLFIWLSLLGALVLNLLPWGRWAGIPDFLAVALVFRRDGGAPWMAEFFRPGP